MRPSGRTALIVEDDLGLSDLCADMLREFDLRIEQVASAEAAIDHLCERSGDITVLVADVRLSGAMTGVALAHRVSVLWPSISLIVTSGAPLDEAETLPERAVFVQKPWRALDIVAAADRAARADHSVHAVLL